jgi:hypothetical protein
LVVLALALVATGWSVPSVAAGCRVEVVGEKSPAWRDAARALADSSLSDGDCARVLLDVTGTGATLTFTTIDGRRAERKLRGHDELASTLEALRVTGPRAGQSRSETRPDEPEDSRPIRPEPAGRPALDRVQAASGRARSPAERAPNDPATERSAGDLGIVFALQGGARAGVDQRAEVLLSPAFDGSASLVLRRWELGVTAAWESHYYRLESETLSARESGAVALGVSVGRREPVAGIGLLGGGRLSVAVLDKYETGWSGPADTIVPSDGRSTPVEWRIGPYFGVVLPRQAAIRFRADLRADIVAQSLVQGQAVTPGWGIGGFLGVEASTR